jgi:CDP-diacylglycerol--glycerol-3-phosphate 3-phosphatidyltransferase
MPKWLNIPNTLSMIRIMAIPVIVWLIIHSNASNYPILIGVYCISIWLDFFDGYLARKFSQETELGKILDPIADKLMMTGIVIALVIKTDFPIWLAVIVLSRDLLILVAAAIISRKKHTVTPSILIGKCTFALFGVLILIYIIDLTVAFDMVVLKHFFIPLSFCFMVWSFFEYYWLYKKENRREKHV